MQINVKVDVSREVLENIFITAIEGGSNYWYYITPEAYDIVAKATPNSDKTSFSERLFQAVFDHDAIVPIHDAEGEEDDEPIGYLDINTFQERLELCAKEALWALQEEIDERGDAGSSDVVFQYLALGDYIYG
jgi:hypothetical protein